MPNLNPNSTNYFHSHEPNTNDLVMAMDYDPYGYPVIRIDDTTKQHTSKNRVKTSGSEILFFNSFTGADGDDPEIWDTVVTGTGSVIQQTPNTGFLEMQVGSSVGDKIVRQLRRVIPYTPGRANEVSMAMRFTTPTTGVRRRHGPFSENNGAYFEDGGDGTYYCVTRYTDSNGLHEHRVARADWNVDPLDGTGPSGIVADPEAIQLMIVEYEWYGAGHVEFKFVINNNAYPVHEFYTGNVHPHPWSATPFLPVRVEIENYGGAAGTHSYHVGSTSVLAEGTIGPRGVEYNAATAITGKTTGNTANVFKPMVSIRMKSTQLNAIVIPKDFQAATLDNTGIFYRIVQNSILTGAVWTAVGKGSACEYDVSATAQTNGKVLKEGYISPGNMGEVIKFDDDILYQLGRRTTTTIGDTSDIITVEIASVNANKQAYASINWVEQK